MTDRTAASSQQPRPLTDEQQKALAGRLGAQRISDGQIVGLGTGTTVRYALEALGERVAAGLRIVGVATSRATEEIAGRVGIPLASLDDEPRLDIAIDGADEIDPARNLIKGLGGALVREKLVEVAAARLIIVADESKLVPALGARCPVPVVVVPFGWTHTRDRLAGLGCRPEPRRRAGQPLVTDDGLLILDCWFGQMDDPAAIEARIVATVGVVASGLFLGWPVEAIVGHADGSVTD
jgi:ribose 5-phosphate isomerase A